MLAHMPVSPQRSALEEQLESRYKSYVAVSAKPPTIKGKTRRLPEFLQFAKNLFALRGETVSDSDVLASNTACRLFLVMIADQNLGKTVVQATCTMLQTHRDLAHPGLYPLAKLRSIKMLLDAIDKNVLTKAHQAPGLTKMHIEMVLRRWGDSDRWDEVMMAAVMGIGFLDTLRPIEISFLGSAAVWWVMRSGEEVRSNFKKLPPPYKHIKGLILALLPRKNRQGQISYVPAPTGLVVKAMHRHATNMHHLAPDSHFFFPARKAPPFSNKRYTWHQKARWVPNQENPFSQRSISSVAIPTALQLCCGIPRKKALMYTGYSLRVGGSTYHEEAGTAESVRKNLAEWMSLATARHYLQHSPKTQFSYLQKAAF